MVVTLARLYSLLSLDPLQRGRRGAVEQLGELVQAPLRWAIAAVFTAQQLVSLRASQRAEYFADAIGARVASPGSMADALDAMVTGRDTYQFVIERRAKRQLHLVSSDSGPDFWDELRSALEALPETELERRRRVSQRAAPQVTDTHPPAYLRIRMMRGLPPGAVSVRLSTAQEDKIRAELAGDYARIGSLREVA